jgi:predicted phosphate transport protein (TIGR00153 family)
MIHLHDVVEAVLQLEPLLESARIGNWESVEVISDKISQLEKKADSSHRDAVIAISKGVFFSGIRDDFLQLMEQNDTIADATHIAAKIISDTPIDKHSFQILYEKPNETVIELIDRTKETVHLLENSIKAIAVDAQLAVSKSLLVEHVEGESSAIRDRLIKRIFSHKNELDVLTLLQLRDFVLRLDDVASAAEDSSDIVIALVTKAQA